MKRQREEEKIEGGRGSKKMCEREPHRERTRDIHTDTKRQTVTRKERHKKDMEKDIQNTKKERHTKSDAQKERHAEAERET